MTFLDKLFGRFGTPPLTPKLISCQPETQELLTALSPCLTLAEAIDTKMGVDHYDFATRIRSIIEDLQTYRGWLEDSKEQE